MCFKLLFWYHHCAASKPGNQFVQSATEKSEK